MLIKVLSPFDPSLRKYHHLHRHHRHHLHLHPHRCVHLDPGGPLSARRRAASIVFFVRRPTHLFPCENRSGIDAFAKFRVHYVIKHSVRDERARCSVCDEAPTRRLEGGQYPLEERVLVDA